MNETWCFSCGAPVRSGGLVKLCERCKQAGRQVAPERLRWMVRTKDGSSRGPMGKAALVDQVVRGALQPDDRVARVGGTWSRLCEHPDFRQHFLPGTEESRQLSQDQVTEKKEIKEYTTRRRAGAVGALAFALAGIGLAVVATQQGLFVLPEDQVRTVQTFFSEAGEELSQQLDPEAAEQEAREAAQAQQAVPGDGIVDDLAEALAGLEGSPSVHLAQGRTALWTGTHQGALVGREHFEKALVLNPGDPEAAAGLARSLARLVYSDPSLAEVASEFAARASTQAPNSPSSLLAQAEVALAKGNRDVALDLVTPCGKPADTAGLEGSNVDLDCGVMVATLGRKTADLEVLNERFPGVDVIRLGLAESLLAEQQFDRANALLGPLMKSMEGDSAPWRLRFQTAFATGNWRETLSTGKRVKQMDPDRLALRLAHAEVLLKVQGDASAAHTEYEAILSHPNGAALPNQPRLLTDAAAAALAADQPDRSLALAEQALTLDRGAPGAVLQQAHALLALGRDTEAQAALRDVDLNRTDGNLGARYHTAAAQVFLANGLARQAVAELRGALDSDPTWPEVHLVSAQAKLLTGNLAGAIEDIEAAAYLDQGQAQRRSPLEEVWYPKRTWRDLRRDLETALVGDAMFADRGPAAVAIVAWYGNMPDRSRLMNRALEAGSAAQSAYAARAQQLLDASDHKRAHDHAERVLSSGNDLTFIEALKGRCLAAMGRMPEANAAFAKATDEPHKIAGVYRLLAEVRLMQGDKKAATEALQNLLKLAPNDLPAQRALVELRNEAG